MTEPVKAGWMQRQTEIFKRWKRQYCVLYMGGGFSYFSDETRRTSEGSLHLPTNLNFIKVGVEVLETSAPPDKTMSCLLELQTTNGNMFFCADSPDDSAAWKATMVEVKNMNVRGGANQHPPQQPPPQQPPPQQPPPQQPPPYPSSVPPPLAPPPAPNTNPPAYRTAYPQAYQQPYPQSYPQTYPQGVPPPYYTPTQNVVTNVYRSGRRGYPRQTTVYSYPGQAYYGHGGNTTVYSTTNGPSTAYSSNPNQQGQTTVIVQENRDYTGAGFVAGAAVGTMMMSPMLFW